MKVLVTGSNGFLGKELVRQLREKGHEAREFSRSSGKDVTDENAVRDAVKGVDAIAHLAALIESGDGAMMEKVNLGGTKNLVKAAEAAKVKRFVFISTVAVMGSADAVLDENSPENPKSIYARTKLLAEKEVAKIKGAQFTILRPSMIYGPNQYWARVAKLIEYGVPFVGDCSKANQMVYVKDMASAVIFALESQKAAGQAFIVAETGGKTWEEIFRIVAKEAGTGKAGAKCASSGFWKLYIRVLWLLFRFTCKGGIIDPKGMEEMIITRKYSTAKINKAGWAARYSLEEGMKETYSELKKQGLV